MIEFNLYWKLFNYQWILPFDEKIPSSINSGVRVQFKFFWKLNADVCCNLIFFYYFDVSSLKYSGNFSFFFLTYTKLLKMSLLLSFLSSIAFELIRSYSRDKSSVFSFCLGRFSLDCVWSKNLLFLIIWAFIPEKRVYLSKKLLDCLETFSSFYVAR